MRSCAHFGVKGVVVQDAALLESGAAIRTAEGGAEHVQPITGDNIVNVLDDFRQAGYTCLLYTSNNFDLFPFAQQLDDIAHKDCWQVEVWRTDG